MDGSSRDVSRLEMNLYGQARLRYILKKARDMANGKKLRPDDLHSLDLLHFCGMSDSVAFLSRESETVPGTLRVLDIGAGLGGPSRFIASRFNGAVITAVEYSPEQAQIFAILNDLCDIGERIRIHCDDFTKMETADLGIQDVIVSQLCFLHISDKPRLFAQCSKVLRLSGAMYVEDFFLLEPLAEDEIELLKNDVAVPEGSLLTEKAYREALRAADIDVNCWENMTVEWSEFVWKRCETFLRDDVSLRINEHVLFSEMSHFYIQIARVFHSEVDGSRFPLTFSHVGQQWLSRPQRLGGVRFVARTI